MTDTLMLLATIGYSLAALAYLGLSALIVVSWRRRPQGRLLALATILSAAWGALSALTAWGELPPRLGLAAEVARNGAWLALLLYILHLRLPGTPLPPPLRFLCLGLGGVFVYDFLLYANAALFHALDAQMWAARGYVAALVAPLIAISAARNPEWSAPVGLSRSMAFHTASLLAAGIYLLLIAGAGYYLRLFGGEWGDVVQTVFLFVAAMVLVLLMLSGTLRARLRVFLSKHFFSYRYDYREEWLNFTRTLTEGAPGERLCERAVEALAKLLESPGGALWMREGDAGYQRAAHWNWGDINGTEPAGSAFIQWLANKQWVVDLDEMKTRRDLYGDLEAPAWIREAEDTWLIVPLLLHDELLGFVVLKHSLAKIGFNWEVSDLIKVAARQAAAHLAQMRAANALIVARQFESFNRTTTFVIHDL